PTAIRDASRVSFEVSGPVCEATFAAGAERPPGADDPVDCNATMPPPVSTAARPTAADTRHPRFRRPFASGVPSPVALIVITQPFPLSVK
ncbi:hypothetical protein, partial [Streptomyces himastatinicus]|uniref:hypothetical protein n=1 Tax=Streptomyces himastatinicus TaxID=998084 RepID=UPI0001B51F99